MARIKKSIADTARARGGKVTAIDPKALASIRREVRATANQAVRDTISTLRSMDWLGPQQPVPPQAPPETADIRTWDYPVGYNVDWQPRKYTPYTFAQLQWLADSFDVLREVIERRKDEVCTVGWDIVHIDGEDLDNDAQAQEIKKFFRFPDRSNPFPSWLRMVLEDMYVTDSATIYPRRTLSGEIYAFDVIAGATITPLIDESGRPPEPPDPAYSQVIKGMPYRFFNDTKVIEEGDQVEFFSKQELVYFPRNRRPYAPVFGFSQVEQLVMTIAIGIKAEQRQYFYYTEGSMPDSLVSVPDNWTGKQLAQFQALWDALMKGNLRARSGGVRFIPGGMREVAMKDYKFDREMWEWLARMCCAALHVSPQPYVQMMNRATGETAQLMQIQEGLEPDKEWVAALMTLLIMVGWGRGDLKFAWQEDEKQVDVAEQAKADDLNLKNGSKTIAELRAERGDQPYPVGIGDKPFLITANGPMLLEDIELQSKAATESAQNGAAGAAANGKQNGNGKSPAQSEAGSANGGQADATEQARKALAAGGAHRIVKVAGRRFIEFGEWLAPLEVL